MYIFFNNHPFLMPVEIQHNPSISRNAFFNQIALFALYLIILVGKPASRSKTVSLGLFIIGLLKINIAC